MAIKTKAYDGKHIVTTSQAVDLQTALALGLPMQYLQNTTLNEALSINADKMPDPESRPTMTYLAVGNGAHVVATAQNIPTPIALRHQPSDTSLYNILPQILRPVDKDLSDEERKRYALRRIVQYHGKNYVGYWLRRCDFRGVRPEHWLTRVQDGQKSVIEFEYSEINNRPTPPTMPDYNYEVSDQLVLADGDYIHVKAPTTITFDEFDVQEMQNVAAIIYGDPTLAVVSEIAYCCGVDTEAVGESAVGSPFNYTEAMGVKTCIFLSTFVNMAFQNKGMAWDLDIGNAEPFALAPGQTPVEQGNVRGNYVDNGATLV